MKSKILIFIFLFTAIFSNAQSKVGSIDSQLIIVLMPENEKVISLLNRYIVRLDSSFQKKVKNYTGKIDAFKKLDKDISDNYKKVKVDEIKKLDEELKQTKLNSEKLIQLKREELMRPLYKKVSNLIAETAKENSYTQILTSSGNEFAYLDEKYDITKLVMDKLGLKMPVTKK
jgi:outer membrane protein